MKVYISQLSFYDLYLGLVLLNVTTEHLYERFSFQKLSGQAILLEPESDSAKFFKISSSGQMLMADEAMPRCRGGGDHLVTRWTMSYLKIRKDSGSVRCALHSLDLFKEFSSILLNFTETLIGSLRAPASDRQLLECSSTAVAELAYSRLRLMCKATLTYGHEKFSAIFLQDGEIAL